MITSSNGNIFRIPGHMCGEFTGHRWIPRHKGQWRGALMFSLICAWINGWVNNREAGDLRRDRVHYDVTVMIRWNNEWEIHTYNRCFLDYFPDDVCFSKTSDDTHACAQMLASEHLKNTNWGQNKIVDNLGTAFLGIFLNKGFKIAIKISFWRPPKRWNWHCFW